MFPQMLYNYESVLQADVTTGGWSDTIAVESNTNPMYLAVSAFNSQC